MEQVAWKGLFADWPPELAPRGVLVTTFAEQIPFDGFLTSEQFVVIFRTTPDTVGARQVVVPYENIAALKIVDVIKIKPFEAMGFKAVPGKKATR
jgi:hypothetical protein